MPRQRQHTAARAHVDHYQIIGTRLDGSELVLWSEADRDKAERQLEMFRLYLRGYVALRVDEVGPSYWRP